MCVPGGNGVGATASLGTQAFGVGMSTVGAFFSARAEQRALRSQARMAEINAKIADENARAEVERGIWQESQIKMAGTQTKSKQIARLAASGIDIAGSASAQAALAGTDLVTQVDANRARANATRAAFGQRIEAGNLRRSAVSARATASSISPGLAGFSTLLSGAGKVASSWYGLNKQGAFSETPMPGAEVSMDPSKNMLVPMVSAPQRQTMGGDTFSVYDTLKWAF